MIRENHDTRQRSLDLLRWGLIPHQCDDPAGGRKPIIAKAETIASLPTLGAALDPGELTPKLADDEHRSIVLP